ncbi:MAG: hypothetical protein II631_07840, partial [Treponema sp.]|nr:hypothetical protein [Treponema sp.]
MKKSIALLLLFLLIFLSPTVAEDLGTVTADKYGSGISFRLPYRNAKGRSKYFNEEVKPYAPDSWFVDDYKNRVGCEINFNKFFFEYIPPV